MKSYILSLTATCCLLVAHSNSYAEVVAYGFTGKLTSVSSNGAPAITGGKVSGTVYFDKDAPPVSGSPFGYNYADPTLNLSGTFYVTGTPYSFDDAQSKTDILSAGYDPFSTNNDSFGFRRTGSNTYLQVSLEHLPQGTIQLGDLSYLDENLNYPTLPPGVTGQFELRLPTGVGSTLRIFEGTIDSFVPIAVPEPSTVALAGIGGIAMLAHLIRRRLSMNS